MPTKQRPVAPLKVLFICSEPQCVKAPCCGRRGASSEWPSDYWGVALQEVCGARPFLFLSHLIVRKIVFLCSLFPRHCYMLCSWFAKLRWQSFMDCHLHCRQPQQPFPVINLITSGICCSYGKLTGTPAVYTVVLLGGNLISIKIV